MKGKVVKALKEYINALAQYIKQNPKTFDVPTDTPCLEALWWHYAGFFPLQNAVTKEKYAELREALSASDQVDPDEIMDKVISLCSEYEKIAFIAGLKLGVQLMTEVSQQRD